MKGADDQHGLLVKRRMQSLFSKHQSALRDYLFKNSYEIAPGKGSYSGDTASQPILIDSALHKENDAILLLTILHEQLHWSEGKPATDPSNKLSQPTNEKGLAKAVIAMYEAFPDLPTSYLHGGAGSMHKSQVHLIVNFLELQAGKRYLGAETAYRELCASKIYSAIYRTMIRNEEFIANILQKNNLLMEPWSGSSTYKCPQGGGIEARKVTSPDEKPQVFSE